MYLMLSTVIFIIGAIGVMARRNTIILFMCIELMLNAVNLLLVAFSKMHHLARAATDASAGTDGQLANVNPSFTWVRLAQRIPVRITIDKIPPQVRMIPGQTATVVVHPRKDGRSAHRSLPW